CMYFTYWNRGKLYNIFSVGIPLWNSILIQTLTVNGIVASAAAINPENEIATAAVLNNGWVQLRTGCVTNN
ncbi:MAG: hypothetical protein LH473_08730, partial [Chitinophagales bacterium]|nr:hypothetical protein [Chitinophagales bacterium]